MESVVNCARNELRREILIDLLEGQEDCDVIFHLKDQVVVKGHSYILSAHSSKFNCENRAVPLVFVMDSRIEQSILWIVLRYLYVRQHFEMNVDYLDSYILCAYFFDDQSLMIAADTLLLSRMSKMTAIEIFHYAIEMKMSYSCKKWIFEYINRNVMKLPTSYTFEMVLMQPNILSIAQNLHKIYMENISKGVHDLPPIFEINSEVFELTVSVTGEPSIVIHNIHDVIEGADNLVPESCNLFEEIEKKIDELENLENDSLLEQIEEQLDVLGSSGHDPLLEQIGEPDMDPLFEEIEEQLDAIGILGHNALYEQIEDLLDVVGVTDATAGASRSARNLCRNFDFL